MKWSKILNFVTFKSQKDVKHSTWSTRMSFIVRAHIGYRLQNDIQNMKWVFSALLETYTRIVGLTRPYQFFLTIHDHRPIWVI
jgi:hypothetical protein